MSLPFDIVDVFAEEKYAGNQLAVVRNAGHLSDEDMQKIALEMNYSETTFILSDQPRNGGYDVRIFTPGGELPFAGHPTLGTAYIIRELLIGQPVNQLILNLKVGQVPVTFDGDMVWLQQKEVSFGEILTPEQLAPVLNLPVEAFDERFPIQEVSTGNPFIIIPIKTLAFVKQIKVDVERCFALIEPYTAKKLFVFCPETYHPENHLNGRGFVHSSGIPEDPATGSANTCLAGYLVNYRYFGSDTIDIRVEQGYEIRRPSLLLLRAGQRDQQIEVNVGGQVIPVARGELL